uniref:Putative DNA internalization-related competence protein ComEC/Rec2 n=1 Tax=uncultured Aquificaceae bacterium TaxID=374108 RepID=A0A146JBK8_9AQUI|nr:putative DNA internalization-related competence protein ComEC/Rec2 [uncultured Aquificaceae bacterium]
MIYPWFFPLFSLILGILINYHLNTYIPIFTPFLVLILSLFLKDVWRYSLLNLSVFLLALSISYKEDVPKIDIKNPSFFECRVMSFPDYYTTSTSFNCKVLNSDYKELINKTVKVYSQEEDIYFYSRVAFLGNGMKTIRYFTKVDNSDNPFYFIFRFKENLIKNYGLHRLNNQTFSVGTALIFGERKYLDSQVYKSFVETGLAHLIAISGSHIAILFFSLNFILFFLNERVRYIILAFVLPFYAVFTGFGIPVVRAVFMALLFIFSKILYLKNNSLNILFFTAFVFLVLNPDSLFSVSFQLSFMAVLGIILAVEFFKEYNIWINLFVVSVFATLFTAPIILYYFYNFSPTTIFATPVASLPLYPILTLSVFNVLTGFSLDFLVKFMDFWILVFISIVKFFANLGFYYTGFSPSLWLILLYFLFVFLILILNIKPTQKVGFTLAIFILFLFLSKSDLSPKIYTFKTKFYPVVFVSYYGNCYLIADFEYRKILNVLKKESCEKSYILTENPEKFSDDFLSNFNHVITYQYNVKLNNLTFKKWIQPYILIDGKEYFLDNQDNLILLQSIEK